MSTTAHVSLPLNTKGRDYIVGDVHGCFSMLRTALARLNFNPDTDRLFAVGDLIDRGPESAEVITWLQQPWFHTVRGNHEHMFSSQISREKSLRKDWVQAMADSEVAYLHQALSHLPYALDFQTSKGLVGIVHAEVPQGISWQDFTKGVQNPKSDYRESALWDNERLRNNNIIPVSGVFRVFAGHKAQMNAPRRLGNVFYIDTGAFKRQIDPDNAFSTLTVVSPTASDTVLTRRMAGVPAISLRTLKINA